MDFHLACTRCGRDVRLPADRAGLTNYCLNCGELLPSGPPSSSPNAAAPRSLLKNVIVFGIGALSAFYLFNPTAGFLELLPDNLPVIGNLDEATATLLLLRSLSYFGVDLSRLINPKKP